MTDEMAVDAEGRPYVIVRASSAGVHAGFLVEDHGADRIVLGDSRRMWRWHGRTLSGVAMEGPDHLSLCKFGDRLPSITVMGACEIIPCTVGAMGRINDVAIWVND